MGKNFIGDNHVKMDVAIEIMADMIGKLSIQKNKETNPETIVKIEKKLELLSKERYEMYAGNKEVIEKILTVYAEEIREYYRSEDNV